MTSPNKRVGVIGCGPSGISVLSAFNQAQLNGQTIPEIVCFEKQDSVGGLWNYTFYTGTDQYGEQCHGSMYRYLWSNGPKEVLEFGDYSFRDHFGKPISSYPPRPVLKDYVVGKAKKHDIGRFVRLSTIVRHVEKVGDQFSVISENLKSREQKKELFDYIIVASGHFSVPSQPTYPGIENFNGRIMHSHDFRDAVGFQGQKMLLIGNGYSAEDIALQCNKYGVKDITISYRSSPTGFKWPEGVREIPQLDKYENGRFHFKDGSSDSYEVLMFCTGYQHHFSFLTEDIRLNAKNYLFVEDLYKGIILNKNPQIIYIGMHDQYYTFTMFDIQGCYARDYILGKIEIGNEAERTADIEYWGEYFSKVKDGHDEIDYQRDYVTDLLKYCDYPEHGHEKRAELLHRWKGERKENITTYRDKSYTSVMTGDVGPIPKTPWMKNMDDSLEGYINTI